jgi:hypothetical protein
MTSQICSAANNLKGTVLRLSMWVAVAMLLSGGQAFAAPPATMPIWRIQIYFETFNTSDAGSDDSVRVELRSNNGTWVDSPLDDWEIGSRTYDLRLDGISRLSDIDYLRVSKTGSDGWCIGRIRLIVNGAALYDERFPSGLWLDNSGGHSTVYFIDDFFMRQRAEWINYVAPARPNIVPVGDMKSRIQCLFGDFTTSTDGSVTDLGFRGSNPISIWTLDANSWHVSVDLEDGKPWPIPDQDVDVDFDLTVAWMGSRILLRPDFRVENLNVDWTWPGYGGDAVTFMNSYFQPRLNEMMKNFTYTIGTGIQLAPTGDLHFIPIVIDPWPVVIGAASTPEQGRATPAVEMPDRNRSPMVLRVRTDSDIKPFAETTFTAAVRSNLSEDTDVDVAIELPAAINVSNAEIEARDSTGARWLTPKIEPQGNGSTLITLRDRLAANKETTYALRLIFLPGEANTAQITTRITPATLAMTEKVAPLSAATRFRFDPSGISAEGTMIRRAAPIKSR